MVVTGKELEGDEFQGVLLLYKVNGQDLLGQEDGFAVEEEFRFEEEWIMIAAWAVLVRI